MSTTQKSGEDLDINPIQLEVIEVIDALFEGKYRVFSIDPNDDSRFALGTPDFSVDHTTGNFTGHAKAFRVTPEGRIIPLIGKEDVPITVGGQEGIEYLHFAVVLMSYPSLNAAVDADNQNHEFLDRAHGMLHLGEQIGFDFPIDVTIQAVRMCAQGYGLL